MTTFAATHSVDTPKSTAVDTLTYNERTGELVIDWSGELWKYSGITKSTFDQVLKGTYKNSPAHASVGRSASKIKRDFGPGEKLGRFGEVKFVDANARQATFPTQAVKTATTAGQVATSSTARSPYLSLTPSPATAAPTSKGSDSVATYTVDFKLDGMNDAREYTPSGVSSVDEAVKALHDSLAVLGLNARVTGVYVDFEGEDDE